MNPYTEKMKVEDEYEDLQIKIEVLEDIQRTHNTFVFWERIEELYTRLYQLQKKLYS